MERLIAQIIIKMYQSLLHFVPKEVYWNILVYLIEP
jgi:hypothetical protein